MAKHFTYKRMKYAGKQLDAGQVFEPGNHPNTQIMEGLGGYIGEITKDMPCPACVKCGSVFITESFLEAHQIDCPAAEVDLTSVAEEAETVGV